MMPVRIDARRRPRARTIRPGRRRQTEAEIQISIVAALRALGYVVQHVVGGGRDGSIGGSWYRSLGVEPGFPDLIVMRGGRCCLMEVKTQRGRVSAAQVRYHLMAEAAGVPVVVVRSAGDAVTAAKKIISGA